MKAGALEEKVVAIFEKLWCNIPTERTEACNRISTKNPAVLVKFSQRKDCQQIWDVKKDLQKIKMEDIDLPGLNKSFINKSLCTYYKVIWAKSKKLHTLGKIHGFFISDLWRCYCFLYLYTDVYWVLDHRVYLFRFLHYRVHCRTFLTMSPETC